MTEKVAQEDRIPILKSSQNHLKVSNLPCHIDSFCQHITHSSCTDHSFLVPQEFIALCEVLELIPQDELELSRQKQHDTIANRRAQKVRPNYFFFALNINTVHSIIES